jgi:flagellar hook-associated protein 2
VSTSSLSLGSSVGSPITVSGLASGLDTSSIIAELMSVEREPVTHLTNEQAKLQGEETALQGIQSSLRQLSLAASEFSLPSLFESSQTVTSNEPARVSAVATAGAAIGAYEVEVTKLANSAQRTFTFTRPAHEDTITIDGQEFKVSAGESAQQLAGAINSDSKATVYAAALENGTIVLSNRATGSTGGEFIKVTDAGGTLAEVAGSAKEGEDAEFKVDGTAGTSSSNTVTAAIAGVTLTLGGLTPVGPVTIDVQAPGPSASKVEAQVQSFVKLYNSTVETIEQQLNTRPPEKPHAGEFGTGTLFGDVELTGLLDSMRVAMYEPIAKLEGAISSPLDIGLSTGAPTGSGGSSQASLEGLLTLEPAKLAEAVKANPDGVQTMLQQWSQKLQGLVNAASEPGGSLEARVTGDASQITQLTGQINNMNEMLAVREKSLQRTYAELEAVISQNTAKSDWLTQQTESLGKSGA